MYWHNETKFTHTQKKMQGVQDLLDTEYMVRNFAAERAYVDDGHDKVLDNARALYTWGEFEYKCINSGRIASAPSHVCNTTTCIMKKINAFVYRRTAHDAIHHANEGQTATGFDRSTRMVTYHMCFERQCAHLVPKHHCEPRENCPHDRQYAPIDIRKLDDFWVCDSTGNVHMCGMLCNHPKIVTAYEHDFVCPLTGTIVCRNVCMDAPGAYVAKMVREAPDTFTPLLLMPSGNPANTGKRRMSHNTCRSRQLRQWEDEALMDKYRQYVREVCDELLFSHDRQMMEAKSCIEEYEKTYTDTLRAFTDKRNGRILNLVDLLSAYRANTWHNPYFDTVPIQPEVQAYMVQQLAEIDTKYTGGFKQTASAASAQTVSIDEYNQIVHETAHMIQTAIAKYRTTHHSSRREEVKTWTSASWQEDMQTVKNMFAFTVVTVWTNLNKHRCVASPPSSTPHAAQCVEKDVSNFYRLVIPLIYMTRRNFTLYDSPAQDNGATSAYYVPVIPNIEFATLLPHENKLQKFASTNTHGTGPHQASGNSALYMKKMTSAQTNVKRVLDQIRNDGKLSDIKLSIEDVCAHILKYYGNKKH